MSETRTVLERAARRAPRVEYDIEMLRDSLMSMLRRDRRHAGAISVILIAALAVGSVAVLRSRGGSTPSSSDEPYGPLPAAWAPLPDPADDGYAFLRTTGRSIASGEQQPDGSMEFRWDEATCTSWWAEDGSGRTRCERKGDVTDDVTYRSGEWPTEIDTAALPGSPAELAAYLTGSLPSPVADGTPTPGATTDDTRLWRAADALVTAPNVSLAVRAALVDVISGVAFADVDLDATDPVGRPAYRIRVVDAHEGSDGIAYDYYVDPATHLPLASSETDLGADQAWTFEIVIETGVSGSTDATAPSVIPAPVSAPTDALPRDGRDDVVNRCSQGSNDLTLTRSAEGYDHDCFVVEATTPFTITFRIETHAEGRIAIHEVGSDEPWFAAPPLSGPGEARYEIPALDYREDGRNSYLVRDGDVFVGTLYVR